MPPAAPPIPLPKAWPAQTRSGLLHAVALARSALVTARGWCANSPLARARLAAENDQLRSELALVREEMRIKDARLARVPPAQRPHYPPPERLAILTLRAARGWSAEEAARRFFVTGATIANWMARLDEQGEDALVRTPTPVNRFPDVVRDLVVRLRATLPAMGTRRIADVLARAGLHLSRTTVRRVVKQPPSVPKPPSPAPAKEPSGRTVTAKHPNHVFNVDLTVMPTASGFWVPWVPQSWAQIWPFCWWVGIVIDHFSRRVVARALWRKEPTAAEVIALLDAAVKNAGRPPKYTVSDQGVQFQGEYQDWCRAHSVKPRFGAIGRYGSIALLERFMLTLKAEGLRRLVLIPLNQRAMLEEVTVFLDWYNEARPHQGLAGATPNELYFGRERARDGPRYQARGSYPTGHVKLRADPGTVVELRVEAFQGRPHLPVVELRPAA